MASENRPSALRHPHRELMQRLQTYHAAECYISSSGPLTSACEAHLSLATALINAFWMGPLLTSKWVRKQNCVRFTLLFWALLCGEDKAATLWCEGTMMAVHGAASAAGSSEWRQVYGSWTQLSMHDIRQFHVIGYRSCLERDLENYASPTVLSLGVGVQSVLWWGAREAGGISILVKKAASVVWLVMDSLEAQTEGGKATKLNYTLNNTSHLWTNVATPILNLLPLKVPHGAAVGVLPHFLPLRTDD